MNKFTTVVFDWAGTTVDYGCFAPVQAFAGAFKSYGIEVTMDEVRKPMGMLKKEHIRTMLKMDRIHTAFVEKYGREVEEKDIDAIYDKFEDSLFAILDNCADLKPGVVETMDALRAKGIKIGATTGYTNEMMAVITKIAKEQGYEPDYWCSPDAVEGEGRPNPFMVHKNMFELKVQDVRQVIKVGDTVSDINEGKNAGAFAIGIIEGSSEMGLTIEEYEALSDEERASKDAVVKQRYLDAGADAVIQDIRGVLEYV